MWSHNSPITKKYLCVYLKINKENCENERKSSDYKRVILLGYTPHIHSNHTVIYLNQWQTKEQEFTDMLSSGFGNME
jgi:hypothetical protein